VIVFIIVVAPRRRPSAIRVRGPRVNPFASAGDNDRPPVEARAVLVAGRP